MEQTIIQLLEGQKITPNPVWLMRQAGRYLPEYRAVRAKSKNFIHFCLTPELAVPVTLQPINRFDFDAAIIFADILLVPLALGQQVEFIEGFGPQLEALDDDFASLLDYHGDVLSPVMQALQSVRAQLAPTKSLIGFAGAPWTVACYMISGNSKDNFSAALSWAHNKPLQLDRLMDILVAATTHYLLAQKQAGADILQLFDSWAGLLAHDENLFSRFIIGPTQKIIAGIRQQQPQAKIIGFPRQAGACLAAYAGQTGCTALGLGHDISIAQAQALQKKLPTQGWLDPGLLLQGGAAMRSGIENILAAMQAGPHIFNLGHGVTPEVPPDHVAELVKIVRGFQP